MFVSIICIFSSVIIYNTRGWWIPLIGGGIAIIGWKFKNQSQIDFGFLLLAGTFFYSLKDIDFNLTNLFFILAAFFLFFSGRYLLRRSSLVIDLRKKSIKGSARKNLNEFKTDSMIYYFRISLFAFLLSLSGGVISHYTFLGPFPSRYVIPMVITLSILFIIGLYIVSIFLPRKFSAS